MPMAKSLTPRLKGLRTPFILLRDYDGQEPTCIFCEQRFMQGSTKWMKTWEHLDGETSNEELWNLAWAHKYCNNRKNGSIEFTVIADDKIIENKKWESEFDFEGFARERERENKTDEQTEIDLNVAHRQIVSEFLAEKVSTESTWEFNDAINCITLRCETNTGHGSKQSVRNYLDVQCCSEGKYQKEKINGKTVLKRRTGN